MALIRCPSCRYSFEHLGEEPLKRCAQCGRSLQPDDAPQHSEGVDQKKTQRMKTIPKPD
jgi:hypothetical protein